VPVDLLAEVCPLTAADRTAALREAVAHHLRYGAALTARPQLAGDGAGVPSELAYNWSARTTLPQALAACVLAGRAAEARWGFAEAQAHYERALEFWDRVPDAEGCTGVAHLTLSRSAAEAANLAGDHGRSSAL